MNKYLYKISLFIVLAARIFFFSPCASAQGTSLDVSKGTSPYTMPWQLRSVMVGNVLRFDSAIAFYDDKNQNSGGVAAASLLTGAYKLIPDLAILVRAGLVSNSPPGGAPGTTVYINPLVGGLYSISPARDFRLGLFLGMALPVGMGGGNYPRAAVQSALSAGILARAAMDNALFATNYLTVIPGVDVAYIAHGMTIQLETTILQLMRTRGEQIDKDSSRTNLTAGLGLGYSFTPQIFIEGELRYQKWLHNDTVFGAAHPAVENLSFAVGPRFSFRIDAVTIKPGIAYAQGLSGPIANGGYTSTTNSDKILFIDFPMFF